MTPERLIRFKVVLEIYFGTRRRSFLAKTHVTRVSWSDKKGDAPYTAASWWTAQVSRSTNAPVNPPQTFSKVAAEALAKQIAENRGYVGRSETGHAVVTIEPVEVTR